MHCKYCAAVVKKGSTVCPQCGKPIEVVKKSKKKAVGWVIAIIVAVCILALLAVLAVVGILAGSGLILFNLPTGKGNNTITLPVPQKPGNQAATVVGKEELSAKNPFKLVYMSYDSYVLPNSNSRYLCYADIQKLFEGELLIAEQEIYARYGMVFSDAHLQEYFEARDWYSSGSGRFTPNSFEQANLDLFQITRDKKDGKLSQYGNKYITAYPIADGYVIRDSNRRVLNGSELERLTETQLCIARNEILARHGWIFDDTELREYFYSKTWYVPTVSGTAFDYDCLTGTESSNISLIKSYENHTVSVEWSVDNPYVDVYYKYRYQNYIFSNSSHQTITKSDLYGMTEDELCIARNEIWARHGYTFKSDNLMQYFMHFDWYIPTTAMGDSSSLYLNSVEKANFDLIQDAEETAAKNPYKIFEQESIYVPSTPTNGIIQIDEYTYVYNDWCYHISPYRFSAYCR